MSITYREILQKAGAVWFARLVFRRLQREWRIRTAPAKPRRLKPQMVSKSAVPRFFFDAEQISQRVALLKQFTPAARQLTITAANDILAHRFDLLGSGPTDMGANIDWHTDFKTGFRWPLEHHLKLTYDPQDSPHDVKVPWELSRSHHLVTLGQAYAFTQDERYAADFVAQIQAWLAANPLEFGINWAGPMDVAIRVINWVWAFQLFGDSEALTPAFQSAFEQSMYEHGWYLARNLENWWPPNNHLIADYVGLVYLGLLFPQFKTARRWRRIGIKGLFREIERQVCPDGYVHEASTHYHRLVTELCLSATMLCRLNDIEIPDHITQRLEKMLEVIQAYTPPDGLAPIIGDADDGRLHVLSAYRDQVRRSRDHRHLLATGAVLFQREDFAVAAHDQWGDAIWFCGVQIKPMMSKALNRVEAPSAYFPDGGLAVLRRDPDIQIVFDAGGNGQESVGGHAHNDTLSFTLWAYGAPLLIDPGTYCYSADIEQRNAFRATVAHNTLRINSEEVNRFNPQELFRMAEEAHPQVHRWEDTSEYTLIDASHSGYMRLRGEIKHRRQLVLDKASGCCLLRDSLTGTKQNQLEWFWHFAPGAAVFQTEGALLFTSAQQVKLLVQPLDFADLETRIETGWFSERYGMREQAPVTRHSIQSATLPAMYTFLLAPFTEKPPEQNNLRSIIERLNTALHTQTVGTDVV